MEISGYIFVPANLKNKAEEEYIKYNNVNGIIGINITSFNSYISKQIEELPYMLGKKKISQDVKKLLLKKAINKHSDLFKIFENVKDKPSFILLAISYLEAMKKEDMNFENVFKELKISNFLKSKLEEFVNIYLKVEEEYDSNLVDSVDELDIFIQSMNMDNSSFKDTKDKDKISMFFNGYLDFSKKELDAIEAILKNGNDITISLTMDEKYIEDESNIEFNNINTDAGIFGQTYTTYLSLINIAKKLRIEYNVEVLTRDETNLEIETDIKYLGENFSCELVNKYSEEVKNVKINVYKNIYDEIECIAKEIYTNMFNSNARFKDYAIYTNDFIGYENAMNKIFREYDIPMNFDTGIKLKNNIVVIYLKCMMELIKDVDIDINLVLEVLKTGLTGENNENILNFENYIREFDIKGNILDTEFKMNNKDGSYNVVYDLENINGIRDRIYSRIIDFKNSLENTELSIEYVKEIYNHIEKNNVSEIYFKMNRNISLNETEESSIATNMLSKIYEVMDNICLVNKNNKISLEEYMDDFSFLIDNISISNRTKYIDEVEILDINKYTGGTYKHVYIIGVYENGLPGKVSEDNIFKDSELDELKTVGINLKSTSLEKENISMFNIYLAINSAIKSLNFTIPASKITGASLRPSNIIDNVKNLLDVKVIGNISETNNVEKIIGDISKYSEKVAFKNILESISNIDSFNDSEIEKVYIGYNYFLNIESDKNNNGKLPYTEILGYKRKDNNLSKDTIDNLYKETINSSVSKLEKFTSCPFAYLASYTLNLKERQEYILKNMDVGNIIHLAIDTISNILTEKNIKWHELTILEKEESFVTNNVDKIVDNILYNDYTKFEISPKYIMLKDKIKKDLVKVLIGMSESFNNSKFEPLGYEIKFGNGEIFSPIEVKLESGQTILLTGKIDRVDSAKIGDNTYIRVVDYKSSKKDLTLDNIKEGLSLQLMAYMSALLASKDKIANDGDVLPASISYLTITSKVTSISEYEKDKNKLKRNLIKDLKNRGIYIKDVEVLECIDKNFKDSSNSYIDIASRTLSKKNKALEKDEFLEECNNIKDTLKKIGEEIVKGIVKIDPKKTNKQNPCEYCAYRSICRKNIRA